MKTEKVHSDDPVITEVTTEQEPKEIEKIPSFDEWKQKMLAEQAEQEKSKQLEGTFCYRFLVYCALRNIIGKPTLFIYVKVIIGVQFM